MKHKDSSTDDPCRYMERLLHEAASNRSRGLIRWYTLAHAARCGKCGRFLESLRIMIQGLRNARKVDGDQEALERLSARLKS